MQIVKKWFYHNLPSSLHPHVRKIQSWKKTHFDQVMGLLIVSVLAIGVVTSFALVGMNSDIRQRASELYPQYHTCSINSECASGVCRECRTNESCPDLGVKYCFAPDPTRVVAAPIGAACTSNSGCQSGICRECRTNEPCPDNQGKFCFSPDPTRVVIAPTSTPRVSSPTPMRDEYMKCYVPYPAVLVGDKSTARVCNSFDRKKDYPSQTCEMIPYPHEYDIPTFSDFGACLQHIGRYSDLTDLSNRCGEWSDEGCLVSGHDQYVGRPVGSACLMPTSNGLNIQGICQPIPSARYPMPTCECDVGEFGFYNFEDCVLDKNYCIADDVKKCEVINGERTLTYVKTCSAGCNESTGSCRSQKGESCTPADSCFGSDYCNDQGIIVPNSSMCEGGGDDNGGQGENKQFCPYGYVAYDKDYFSEKNCHQPLVWSGKSCVKCDTSMHDCWVPDEYLGYCHVYGDKWSGFCPEGTFGSEQACKDTLPVHYECYSPRQDLTGCFRLTGGDLDRGNSFSQCPPNSVKKLEMCLGALPNLKQCFEPSYDGFQCLDIGNWYIQCPEGSYSPIEECFSALANTEKETDKPDEYGKLNTSNIARVNKTTQTQITIEVIKDGQKVAVPVKTGVCTYTRWFSWVPGWKSVCLDE